MRKIIIFLIALFIQPHLYSQGQYLIKEESGFGLSGIYSIAKKSSGYGFGLGLSFKGIIDVGFGYGKVNDEEVSIDNIKFQDYSDFYSFSVTYILKKIDSDKRTLSIAISVIYESTSTTFEEPVYMFSPPNRSWVQKKRTERIDPAFGIGLILFRNIQQNETSWILPTVAVHHVRTRGISLWGGMAGAAIGTVLNKKVSISFVPAFSFVKFEEQLSWQFGIGLDLVFSNLKEVPHQEQ